MSIFIGIVIGLLIYVFIAFIIAMIRVHKIKKNKPQEQEVEDISKENNSDEIEIK